MSGEIIRVDDFDMAIRKLMENMPDHFEFEIAEHYFRDLPFHVAGQRSRMMNSFMRETKKMGYRNRIDYPKQDHGWRYTLDREPKQNLITNEASAIDV